MNFKKLIKKFSCMALAIATTLAVASCGDTGNGDKVDNGIKNDNVNLISELPEYKRTMPLEIDCWLGPKTCEGALKQYADAGYTMYHLQSGNFSSTRRYSDGELNAWLDHVLTESKKFGLKVVLAPTAVNPSANSIVPFEYTYLRVKDTLEKWKDDETFYGFMSTDETVWDKPLKIKYEEMQYMCRNYEHSIDFIRDDYTYFHSKFPNKYYETVLLGIYNEADSDMPYFLDTKKSFDEYMDWYYKYFVKYVPLENRVYSFDAYPFYRKHDKLLYQDRFVGSLEGVAVNAEKAGAEKGAYMQNHTAVMNSQCISYQYYTAMTYGYTHFTTYCYTDEWGEAEFSTTNGGFETDNYHFYKKAHEEFITLEDVYTNFCNRRIGTMGVNGKKDVRTTWTKCVHMSEKLPLINNVEADEHVMIGAFLDKNGVNGYMIANQMVPDNLKTNNVSIEFNGASRVAVWEGGKPFRMVNAENGKFNIELSSGGGAFVVPMK